MKVLEYVWGHKLTQTNGRTGTTSYVYEAGTGALLSWEGPGEAGKEQKGSQIYDAYGRAEATELADGTRQYVAYDAEGNVIRQWGSQMYPATYEYNAYNQKVSMITYRTAVTERADFPQGEGDKTTWTYDPESGQLLEKVYADGKKTSYTYTPGGKLHSQTNANGLTMTHSYNSAGELVSTGFDDNGLTPTKTYSYDQQGRPTATEQAGKVAYHYVYNESGKLIAEQVEISTANGVLSRAMEHGYDAYGRNTSFKVKQGDVVEQALSYTYNTAGQVSAITADGKEFAYSYLPNAPQLIAGVISPIHAVTNSYEAKRNILESKTNSWKNKADKGVISSYTYNVNNLGQRVSVETAGEAFGATPAPWAWNYDVLGQVIKANNYDYSYDSIGNRKTSGKDNSVLTNYTSNNLNQYTAVNALAPIYDNEGNLLSGLSKTTSLPNRDTLSFVYNAENRPVKVKQGEQTLEEYEYDPMGRRIKAGNTIILYNGYNAVAEYDSNSHQLKTSYTWGLDLSNSTQGAGGVGGLLSVTDYTNQTPLVSYPTYDGNGNISEYLTEQSSSNSSSGTQELGIITAHYEYDAFGNVTKKTGSRDYIYQFSTKPFDALTGLNYYNYRLYDPIDGRWINRDPIYEQGGLNLYAFVGNNSVNKSDYLGKQVSMPPGSGAAIGGAISALTLHLIINNGMANCKDMKKKEKCSKRGCCVIQYFFAKDPGNPSHVFYGSSSSYYLESPCNILRENANKGPQMIRVEPGFKRQVLYFDMKKILFIGVISLFVCTFDVVEADQKEASQSVKILLPELTKQQDGEIEQCVSKRMQFICKDDKLNYRILDRKMCIENIPDGYKDEIKKYIISNFSFEVTPVFQKNRGKDVKYIAFTSFKYSSNDVELLRIKKEPVLDTSDIGDIFYEESDSMLVFSLNEKGKKKMANLMKNFNFGDMFFVKINGDILYYSMMDTIDSMFGLEVKKSLGLILVSQFKFPIPFLENS